MYNKTIIRFSFCDILNNQGLVSVISLAFGSADNTYIDFDYSGYHKITKTLFNNCFLFSKGEVK